LRGGQKLTASSGPRRPCAYNWLRGLDLNQRPLGYEGKTVCLPGRRRQTEEARRVLPHELLRRLLTQRLAPRDHGLGVIGKVGLGGRVVRLEHEHMIPE